MYTALFCLNDNNSMGMPLPRRLSGITVLNEFVRFSDVSHFGDEALMTPL